MTNQDDGHVAGAADDPNAAYWDSLCGWALAQTVEMTGDFHEDLRRFDAAYLDYYPYLLDYVDPPSLSDKDVLEIGLGYGTLGELLTIAGARYVGLDIAAEPVALMRRRLSALGNDVNGAAHQASALALPFPSGSFDYVFSIGCLHHTGDLSRAVSEVGRVLRPGGTATIMVYYRYSLRRLFRTAEAMLARRRSSAAQRLGEMYDKSESGAAPPHTEYLSGREISRLFSEFDHVSFDIRNFQEWMVRGRVIKRTWFLNNVARRLGLDVYVVAVR